MAGNVDALYIFLLIVSGMMTLLIFTALIYFAARYRHRRGVPAEQIEGSIPLEFTWSIIPMCVFMAIFLWSASGGFFALLVRLELLTPAGKTHGARRHLQHASSRSARRRSWCSSSSSLRIPAALGNFLLPIMVGAKDLAFPRINLLSCYHLSSSAAAVDAALPAHRDGVRTPAGPSTRPSASTTSQQRPTSIAATGHLHPPASRRSSPDLNFIVDHPPHARARHDLVAPAVVHLGALCHQHRDLGTPVIAITLVLVVAERALHLGIFDPKLGGDPLLFQHLFWFDPHPAVYIMILPSMGVVTEIIACFSRKRIFGYSFVALSVDRDRRLRLSGLGAPHVRGRNFRLRGARVFSS